MATHKLSTPLEHTKLKNPTQSFEGNNYSVLILASFMVITYTLNCRHLAYERKKDCKEVPNSFTVQTDGEKYKI